MSRTRLAALALAAAGLAGFGCGSSARPTALTRSQLIAKANPICERVISEVDWSKVTPQELPRVVGRLAALEEQAASELDKLIPPASMLAEWRIIIDDFRQTGPEFRTIAQNVKAHPKAYDLLPLANAQHERGFEANVAGITGCVQY